MIHPRLIPLVAKYILRHRARTILTLSGIATAMFLFSAVQAMRAGVAAATRESASDTTLVVYRENRFCPFTSELPQNYESQIAAIPGVVAVIPTRVVLNNCGTSLDVVVFRGVPVDSIPPGTFNLVSGSHEEWTRRSDAALVGERIARRRGLNVGDMLSAAGVTVSIAGIIATGNPQDDNSVYTHLDFVQRAVGNGQGIVTQFNVRVSNPHDLDRVAGAIDMLFESSHAPTWTASEKAFAARSAVDILRLAEFAGWLGLGSLIAVFALVGNAISLSVQDRVKDHAVMRTLGYTEGLILRLIVAESALLGILGGVLGLACAYAVSQYGRFTISMEGISVSVHADTSTLAIGFAVCLLVGVLAGLAPAIRAARLSTTEAFRAV